MKYEYRIRQDEEITLDALNDLGLDGWELVSVCLSIGGPGGRLVYFFKKSIPSLVPLGGVGITNRK